MSSLVIDQLNSMNNINALLSNKDKELDLVDKIKDEISELSRVHGIMRETEVFILDLVQQSLPKATEPEVTEESKKPGEFGSSGDFDNNENASEK